MFQKELNYYPGPTTYEKSQGRQYLNDYMDMRKNAMDGRSENPSKLEEIQEATRVWIESTFDITGQDYENYNRDVTEAKLLGLLAFMAKNYPNEICDSEIRATELFIEASFGLYQEYLDMPDDQEIHEDADCTFAFVVPSRATRTRSDYGVESEMIIPATRYIPNEYRGMFAVGIPPVTLDIYNANSDDSTKGILVLASLFQDSMTDLGLEKAFMVSQKNVNDAVDFVRRRFGAKVVGLGAIIPKITDHGNTISNKNVITTTGHAGTVDMMEQYIKQAVEQGFVTPEAVGKIGFLGLGTIGLAAAENISASYPDSAMYLYDSKDYMREKGRKSFQDLGKTHTMANDVLDFLRNSDIIVSAITDQVNLDAIDPDHKLDLTGKMIIDDSQPGCFEREQVESRGGRVAWVISHDTKGLAQRGGYDYGFMVDSRGDGFGCEAEAASLANYYHELAITRGLGHEVAQRIVSKIAVNEKVSARKARLIGFLMRKSGFEPAQFQVYGDHIDIPDKT